MSPLIDERLPLQLCRQPGTLLEASAGGGGRARGGERPLPLLDASEVSENPGTASRVSWLAGACESSDAAQAEAAGYATLLPPAASGLECIVIIDSAYAATYRFHDAAREDSRLFIGHLGPRHQVDRILLVSGDRERKCAISRSASASPRCTPNAAPRTKWPSRVTRRARADTLFLGDGINDAPALAAATVGIAFGHQSEITTEAAGAVIMDTALERVDELFHIGARMRRVALQSAIGGMALSGAAMLVAAAGWLPPLAGAMLQEVIDLAAVLNALRAAVPGRRAQ